MRMRIEQFSYEAKKAKQKKIFSTIFLILFIFCFTNIMTSVLLFSVKQNSISMAPDIEEKSLVMVTPISPKINRGDVILVKPKTGTWNSLSFFGKMKEILVQFFTFKQYSLINNNKFPCSQYNLRRVVCMPGDTFYMRDYVLYIKPAGEKHFLTEFELTDKKYNVFFSAVPNTWDTEIGVKGSFEAVTLGEGEYFVLGDNRKSCDDSRLIGPVKRSDIRGKALFCYFPFNKIKIY